MIGQDDFDRYRRVLLKYSRMGHEPTEFVSDADTHHLLYATALRPGWIGVGRKQDIPPDSIVRGPVRDNVCMGSTRKYGGSKPANIGDSRHSHL